MNSGPKPFLPPSRSRELGLLLMLILVLVLARGSLAAQPLSARAEPASLSASLGSIATFCISAQGAGPFSYQWQKNGLNLPDQTNECITLTQVAISDGGSYRATVFNGAGALESDEASLLVVLKFLPGGDQFVKSEPIATLSNSVRGVSFGATRDLSEPLHLNLRTSNSVWYVWTAPATGIATFDTQGSTFDTLLAVYTGSYLSALTEVASDDDSGGFHASKVSWNAEAGTQYRIAIDGLTGETGTYVCRWNLEVTGSRIPVFISQPRSQTVLLGGTAFFEAKTTEADSSLRVQWFHNGIPIGGATHSGLTLSQVETSDLGQYSLAVTNSVGRSSVSALADLEIGPNPTVQSKDKLAEMIPPGDTARSALSIAGASTGTFSLAAGTLINQRFFNAGTTDRCEPAHCGAPGGASRWFQLAAESDGICTLDTQGSDVDTVLAVYLQNFSICSNLYEPLVDCNNDALGSCHEILERNGSRERGSRLSFLATAGTVYRAVVDTVGGIRGTNIQFSVHFQSDASSQASDSPLGDSVERFLQARGTSLALRVATNFALPNSTYQWQVNGRRIAGAVRERLVLPFLNYSDSGRYSVTIQNETLQRTLPGAVVAVADPCQSGATAKTEGAPATFMLLGTVSEAVTLEATESLDTLLPWGVLGTIAPSVDPTLWDVSSAPSRFYRLSPPRPGSE